jgi:hypothetical protein
MLGKADTTLCNEDRQSGNNGEWLSPFRTTAGSLLEAMWGRELMGTLLEIRCPAAIKHAAAVLYPETLDCGIALCRIGSGSVLLEEAAKYDNKHKNT